MKENEGINKEDAPDKELIWINRLADWLDNKFRIPGIYSNPNLGKCFTL